VPEIRYLTDQQTSEVREAGRWIASWEAASLQGTKKTDVETGEDSKGT